MLILSDIIKNDIAIDVTTLTYLVVIHNEPNSIFIATNRQSFPLSPLFESIFWEDVNFKLSGMKESIDLVQRRFKINNVNFTISNYEINGQRFSNLISENALINKLVSIYYKTASCQSLDDCALLYKGKIRRIKHDAEIATLSLEDSTEDKLSKNLPFANIGYRRAAYSKEYNGRPIPILYGQVDKAPAIPLFDESLDENDSYSQNKIHVICDDTRSDRDIHLGGFFQDDEISHIETGINPLYIHKGDYYQVLQDWSYKCTTETDIWEEDNQYRLETDEIVIDKRYHKARAINPPANNEVCCIKKRKPNDLHLLQNPSAQDDQELPTWEDFVGIGVRFTQETVLSPSSCFDTTDSVSQSSYFYSGNFGGIINSYTQIPNQSISLQQDWNWLNLDFRPTHNLGIANNNEIVGDEGLEERRYKWQFEVPSWLTRYAHLFNGEDDEATGLVFIKLPSIELIIKRVNEKLWEQFADADGDLGDIYRYHNEVGLPFPPIVGASNIALGWYTYFQEDATTEQNRAYGDASVRINAETNITGNTLLDWAIKIPDANMIHFNQQYDGDTLYQRAGLFGTASKYVIESYVGLDGITHYIGDTYAYYPSDNEYGEPPINSPAIAFSDYIEFGSYLGSQMNYPNLRIQLKSLADIDTNAPNMYTADVIDTFVTAPISDSENVEFNILDLLQDKFVAIGQEAWETSNYHTQGGGLYLTGNFERIDAKYFDLFDYGEYSNYLFSPDDFPQLKPLTLTSKTKSGNNVTVKYTAKWNGVSPQESPDFNYGAQYGTDIYYFGGKSHISNNVIKENEVLSGQMNASNNDGWAIWVKNEIEANGNTINIGESVEGYTEPNEKNIQQLSKIEIKRNTLIPMLHYED